MAGQLNIRLTDTDDAEFAHWAAELNIERGALGRRTVMEALAARREGRTMFERPEALSPADLQRLIGQVDATMIELDRVLRQHAASDAIRIKSAKKDTAGISEARTAIASQVALVFEQKIQDVVGAITALGRKIDNAPAVAGMHEDLRSLRAELAANRDSDLTTAKGDQAQIICETRKRRALFMLVITDQHWSTSLLMTYGIMLAILGVLILIPAASFFPSLAVPVATQLLRGNNELCEVVDRHYGVTDCVVPGMQHMASEAEMLSTMVPRVHRAKRR